MEEAEQVEFRLLNVDRQLVGMVKSQKTRRGRGLLSHVGRLIGEDCGPDPSPRLFYLVDPTDGSERMVEYLKRPLTEEQARGQSWMYGGSVVLFTNGRWVVRIPVGMREYYLTCTTMVRYITRDPKSRPDDESKEGPQEAVPVSGCD
jgi:hypothetical protein